MSKNNNTGAPNRKLRWLKLDNAAKIYPAAKRRSWSNVFRLSAELTEDVDKDVLQTALDVTVKRFPSIAVRLRRGLFWYYLEELRDAPKVMEDKAYPLSRMPFDDIRKCAFRVLAYKKRIAVEFFHAVTDGNGGLVFLKTLVSEYIKKKYGEEIPSTDGVLDVTEKPSEDELHDSFPDYAGTIPKSRAESNAYKLDGTPETDGFFNLVSLSADAGELLAAAKKRGVTLTVFVCAALMRALLNIQERHVKNPRRYKPVKVLIPVNLRKMFESSSLRNFVLYVTPGIDPRLGEWSFDEICKSVHHQMALEITEKEMRSRITKNVGQEQSMLVRVIPLALKNLIMKAVYNAVGEKKSCLTFSNLGAVKVPKEMEKYVTRMDFVLGIAATLHYICGAMSYNGDFRMSFIRDIKEPELEYEFHKVMRSLGIRMKAESNSRQA